MDIELIVTERHRRFGVAAVAAAGFAVLAVLIRQHAPALGSLDASVHASAHQFGLAHPGWLTTMRAVTHLGDTVTIAVVELAAGVTCLVARRRAAALFALVAGLGTWLLRLAMRELIGRPRPDDGFWPAEGLAFPSGHTANSAAMMVIVVVTAWPYLNRAGRPNAIKVVALGVGAAVPLLVAVSRVAGGVHWPSDVLGGLLLAVAVTAAAAALTRPLR